MSRKRNQSANEVLMRSSWSSLRDLARNDLLQFPVELLDFEQIP